MSEVVSRHASPRRRIPALVATAVLVQTIFLLALRFSDGFDVARSGESFRVAATYLTVLALFGLVHVTFADRPRAHAWVGSIVFALFVAVNFARFETAGAFDYGFLHHNVRELATPLGRRIVGGQVRLVEVILLFVAPILFGICAARVRRPRQVAPRLRFGVAALCSAVIVGLPSAGARTHESLTTFATSALRFHRESRAAEAALAGISYPYVHRFVPSAAAQSLAGAPAARPHVILLFLESWSGVYTDKKRPNGEAITPVFDARRREGLTFDYFYGNSVQSSRGRFATLCSLIPMYRDKDVFRLADAPLRCLPRLLAERGYNTLLQSASDEPEFENSDVFFKHIGFRSVLWEDPARRGKDPLVWGAGLQDDAFYEKFFTTLDQEVAREPDRPLFAVAINVSNHYPFSDNPRHRPAAEPPTKYGRNFVASLQVADAWLATFFEELDKRPAFADAIVVLVGDHSFPADEHGIHFNGLGAREESFRTGFSLRWKGRVPPSTVSDRAASQIDIAPTIADLLQLGHRSHFQGRSLVDAAQAPPSPVPMVQPYDGVRLVAVRHPFKLESHEAAEQEHLYDIAQDPDEEHDLIDEAAYAGEAEALRETIASIRMNEAVLRGKRVWEERTGDRSARLPRPTSTR